MMITLGSNISFRAKLALADKTALSMINPAAAKGKIDTVGIWVDRKNGTNITVGTFHGSGTTWSPRDSVTVGDTNDLTYTVFTGLEIECDVGDVIGAYYLGASFGAYGTYSNGVYQVYAGNGFSGEQTYDASDPFYNRGLCLYGSGEEVSVGSKAFMHYYKNMLAGGVGRQC